MTGDLTSARACDKIPMFAAVVEQADTRDLKSLALKSVPVRSRSPAPKKQIPIRVSAFLIMYGGPGSNLFDADVRWTSAHSRLDGNDTMILSIPVTGTNYTCGGYSEGAAVEKIEEKRKPDDFFGHRKGPPEPLVIPSEAEESSGFTIMRGSLDFAALRSR